MFLLSKESPKYPPLLVSDLATIFFSPEFFDRGLIQLRPFLSFGGFELKMFLPIFLGLVQVSSGAMFKFQAQEVSVNNWIVKTSKSNIR